MATEQDASETDLGIRPQTPAARRANPAATRQRTAEERERLREESRARRKARENGSHPGPPEPSEEQIKVRRLSEPERTGSASSPPGHPAAPAPPAPVAEPAAPTPTARPPAAPAPKASPEAQPAPPPRRPAPATPAARGGVAEREAPEGFVAEREAPQGGVAERQAPERSGPEAFVAERDAPEGGVGQREAPEGFVAERRAPQGGVAEREAPEREAADDGLLHDGAPHESVLARALRAGGALADGLRERHAPVERPLAGGFAGDGGPPGQLVGLPRLPTDPRERGVVLLALASAVGIVICLVASLSSGHLPGFGGADLRVKAESGAVAPGGWVHVSGTDAAANSELILESRSGQAAWRPLGHGSSDGDGRFELKGRVLERPGRVQVRVRSGSVAAAPLAIAVRPLRLASVGDINLQDAPSDAWATVGRPLKRADLAFGNLESAVSNRGEPVAKEYNFRGAPAALAALRKQSGIDVLNLANNHVGDYGPQATVDTVRGVERNGMKAVGAGADLRRALQPQVVERLGLKVAFVGFSEIAPLEFAATTDRPGTAWADPEQIADAVHAAKRKADVVIATFHWGIERQTLETARQRELADVAVRAGAQVVIGAHPHTLQPLRRQGGAIVAYSLGNFVFAAESPETTTTGILELGLTAEGVSRARWRPATIEGGRPLLEKRRPMRIPLRDSLRMAAGVNLF